MDGVLRGMRTVLTASSVWDAQLGVHATTPMNDEHDFTGTAIHIRHDFVDQRTHNAFLEPCIRVWAIPDGLQLASEISELIGGGRWQARRDADLLRDVSFDVAHMLEGVIPSALQFIRDETVLRICRVVLLLRPVRGIAGRLEISLQRREDGITPPAFFLARESGCLNGDRLHRSENILSDCGIHARTAEGDAPSFDMPAIIRRRAEDSAIRQRGRATSRPVHVDSRSARLV